MHAGRAFVGLDPEIEVDVAEVRRAAEVSELPESDDEQSHLLTLLSGEELLPGWYDDWVLAERESLEQMRLRALDRLSRQALDRGDLVLAIDAARSATDIEPHSEAACEVALRAHLARGDLAGVVSEFRRHRDATWDNVGVAPSPRILALVESAVGTTLVEDATPVPDTSLPALRPPPSVAPPAPPSPAPSRRPSPAPAPPLATPTPAAAELAPPDREPTVFPPVAPAPVPAPEERATRGNARVLAGLVGAAVLLLAVSLVVAVGGPRPRREWTGGQHADDGIDGLVRPSAMVHRTAVSSSTGSRRSSASSRPASCPAWPGSP